MSELENTNNDGVTNKPGELNKADKGEIGETNGQLGESKDKGTGNSEFHEELDTVYSKSLENNDKDNSDINNPGEKLNPDNSDESDLKNPNVQPNAETKTDETYKDEIGKTDEQLDESNDKGTGNNEFRDKLNTEYSNSLESNDKDNSDINNLGNKLNPDNEDGETEKDGVDNTDESDLKNSDVDNTDLKNSDVDNTDLKNSDVDNTDNSDINNPKIQPNAETETGETGETGERLSEINKDDIKSGFSEELNSEHSNYLDDLKNDDKSKAGETGIKSENDEIKAGEGLSGINKDDGNSGFSEELDDEHNDYLDDLKNDKTEVGEIDKAGETGTDEDDDKIKAGESKTESENDEINVDIQPNAETKVGEISKAGEVGKTGINQGDGNSGFSEELDDERNSYLNIEGTQSNSNTEVTQPNSNIEPNSETKIGETGKASETGTDKDNQYDSGTKDPKIQPNIESNVEAGQVKYSGTQPNSNTEVTQPSSNIESNAETKVGETGKADDEMGKPELNGLEQQSENDEYGSGNTMALSSREIADVLERRYPGQVSSSTIPPSDAKMVHMAGEKHPVTGVVYDLKGFPIFDDVAVFDTRIPENIASKRDSEAHKRAATRSLRESLQDPDQKRNASLTSFTPEQLSAIKGGRAHIPGFTWHHHQDFSRMQLVPTEEYHKRTGHVGGEYMSKQ